MNLVLLGSLLISLFMLVVYVSFTWMILCLLYVAFLCLNTRFRIL